MEILNQTLHHHQPHQHHHSHHHQAHHNHQTLNNSQTLHKQQNLHTITRLATTTSLAAISSVVINILTTKWVIQHGTQPTSFAANACCNQKSLSPNQPVNFKYPKREYKDNNWSFQPLWYKRWKWLQYNDQKDSVTCYVSWHDHLHYMRPNMKTDDAFIESGCTN